MTELALSYASVISHHDYTTMDNFDFGGEIVWEPTPELIANSNLNAFMTRHKLASYEALMHRSTHDVAWFWRAVLDELRIEFHRPYEKIVDLSRGIAWPTWCVGGGMNIVHNLLDRYAGTATDHTAAVIHEGEDGTARHLTYQQLRQEVNRFASGLKSLGVGKGDVVGVFMPMCAECVIAMLAIIKIGGVFLPLFSGFGAAAAASRLTDAKAKVLVAADGCPRRGKVATMKDVADEALASVPSVKHVVVFRRADCPIPMTPGRDVWWHELVKDQPADVPTEATDAEATMMLIYTSGTTGKPKAAVHTHCGFPIKAAQDARHSMDLHADEVLWWMTDMGWMMGPWLVFCTLLNEATMLLYDGAPDFPGVDRVWQVTARHRVTMLGISPTLVRSLMKHGDGPVRGHDLSALRKFGSTGEPWNPASWMWLFETVGRRKLPIINYSGGTETSGGILCGNVFSPLKPCAFSGPVPGMWADVIDENGNSVRNQVGELVLRAPWIGMTRGFLNDTRRYEETYWSRFDNTWVHGDWAAVDNDGLWYILGRSDDTIKVAGKRLGPAEVESILVEDPAVAEAAVIGVPDPVKGQAVVCFCVLKPGHAPDEALRRSLMDRVIREQGKALAPKAVRFVKDLPKTRNAKVMRRVIRAAYLGDSPGDLSSLENAAAVEEIRNAQ